MSEEKEGKEIRGEEQFQRGEIVITALRKAMVGLDTYHSERELAIKADCDRIAQARLELAEKTRNLEERLEKVIKREEDLMSVRENLAKARVEVRAGIEREKVQSDRIIQLRQEVANLKNELRILENAITGIKSRQEKELTQAPVTVPTPVQEIEKK